MWWGTSTGRPGHEVYLQIVIPVPRKTNQMKPSLFRVISVLADFIRWLLSDVEYDLFKNREVCFSMNLVSISGARALESYWYRLWITSLVTFLVYVFVTALPNASIGCKKAHSIPWWLPACVAECIGHMYTMRKSNAFRRTVQWSRSCYIWCVQRLWSELQRCEVSDYSRGCNQNSKDSEVRQSCTLANQFMTRFTKFNPDPLLRLIV